MTKRKIEKEIFNMTELVGTEKQVKLALYIRENLLAELENVVASVSNNCQKSVVEINKIIEEIKVETSAVFFIEKRESIRESVRESFADMDFYFRL